MCEQTEIQYLDGEVVWVKLGSCWWPGEVIGPEKLPPDVLPSFRKAPIAVVKFFLEDSFEYVKNINSIYKYNCSRKNEFIQKGLALHRSKRGHMEKFPEDIIRAETATNGDTDILTRDEFQETKKESYAGLFGNCRKTPASMKKGRGGKFKPVESPRISTPARKFTKGNPDYKVHILVQGSKSTPQGSELSTPSTSCAGSEPADEGASEKVEKPPSSVMSTPVASSSGQFACHACNFSTSRLNIMILHNKSHSVTFTPYTPSPVRKKAIAKPSPKSISTPNTSKTPKVRQPRKKKSENEAKKPKGQKRSAEEPEHVEVKKTKTDEEIKSSLLADWDDGDEESNDETSSNIMPESPKIPVAAESPAVPIPDDLTTAQVPGESSSPDKRSEASGVEKPESTSDSNRFDFCEDEPDWPEEADAGRKIPRVKNPSRRKDETKSLSIDEEDVVKEVAELLSKTTVPELPAAPESLKVEENFPEPSVVKSPDKPDTYLENAPKRPPTKTIFKTKTFFRSRHSRSQDAIGKYVAEQLNAAERMNTSEAECELNGSDMVPSPDARDSPPLRDSPPVRESLPLRESPRELQEFSPPRDSPPVEHVKVARLAPKIQLKKMKAEAAQLAERERMSYGSVLDVITPMISEEKMVTEPKINTELVKEPRYETVVACQPETRVRNENDVQDSKEDEQDLEAEKHDTVPVTTASEDSIHKRAHLNLISEVPERPPELFMNVSTASAVDALLSVSRDSDRVTKIVSNDPPEDLFEDDRTENISPNNFNGVRQNLNNGEIDQIDVDQNEPVAQQHQVFEHEIVEQPQEAIQNVAVKQSQELSEPKIVPQIENILDSDSVEHNKQGLENEINELSEQVIEPEVVEHNEEGLEHEVIKENAQVPDYEIVEPKEQGPVLEIVEQNKQVPDHEIVEHEEQVLEHEIIEQNQQALNHESVEHNEHFLEHEVVEQNKQFLEHEVVEQCEQLLEHDVIEQNQQVLETEVISEHLKPADNEHDSFSEVPMDNYSNGQPDQQQQDIDFDEKMEVDLACEVVTEEVTTETICENIPLETDSENVPTESDLQIAEALMNLPATLKNKVVNDVENKLQPHISFESQEPEHDVISGGSLLKSNTTYETGYPIENEVVVSQSVSEPTHVASKDDLQFRFKSEQEKSDNFNAAQSLVQMSEAIECKVKSLAEKKKDLNDHLVETSQPIYGKQNNVIEKDVVEQTIASMSEANRTETTLVKTSKYETSSSKLLKILEEPCTPKVISNKTITKHVISPVINKEKILNLDVSSSPLKSKSQSLKQKIIIRRTPAKNLINSVSDTKPEKIILSRTSKPNQESPVQTYTIQASPDSPTDSNTIIIQQKVRKIVNPPTKLQKIKPHTSLIAIPSHQKILNQQPTMTEEALFDINSMPVVLSDDILTPENIEKMPMVLSDGNIITNPATLSSHSKVMKPIQTKIEPEKLPIISSSTKLETQRKTLSINSTGSTSSESSKSTTPNILSKSSKFRGGPKPMIVIDKATGKQKIIMTKAEPTKIIKDNQTTKVKPAGQISGAKGEKFIILPNNTPRQGRTQKIVIDPQTGKAHVLVAKSSDLHTSDNKPVSAKLIPSAPDASPGGGGTVMIITNSQGTQSRIVLTPEHEKLLFPNKQPNVSQIKAIAQRQISPSATTIHKPQTIVTTVAAAPAKTQTRIISKQKSAIITSKGQLIVGGRVATTAQNISPAPEIRPTISKRIIAAEPKKFVQTVQKSSPEPLIFLQQKSGAVMQLTSAQFEHLQRTGQIVPKTTAPAPPIKENKIVVQKSVTITSNDPVLPLIQKQQKARSIRPSIGSSTPAKKLKQEIALAPTPMPANITTVPPLAPISSTMVSEPVPLPPVANPMTTATTSNSYPELENFEELLPSTAIVRQLEPVLPAPLPQPPPPPVQPDPAPPLSDGQLLAVPGDHFGGPPNSFYLCVEDNGTLTPIDNRPLVLENNQLVPMAVEPMPVHAQQPERRDILEAALANSDVFHADTPRDDGPDFRDLNANVSVHCRVSETSTTLNQPIMTPVEVPTKGEGEPTVHSSLEDGLAVIGVTPHSVPTSLELPITVTDPGITRIARKTTDPLTNTTYGMPLLTSSSADMSYVTTEEVDIQYTGPISMPLLTDEDDGVGKSMPILTDDVMERTTASSVESTIGSPSSIDVRESEMEEGGNWSRRLLTPGSDSSETSQEIPLQPAIQISVNELSRNS